jgi:ParB-like chromosome segregation protein Spo0J
MKPVFKTNDDKPSIEGTLAQLTRLLMSLPEEERIDAINKCRLSLHECSPLKSEPVDCVLWIKSEEVKANNYNPNSVAAPELKLLHRSIQADGYTMPIVTFRDSSGGMTIVDGFHRNRVGREFPDIKKRVLGRIPVSVVDESRTGRADLMASTIRHNRARGKHAVTSMADIVLELTRRMWTNEKIADELGMDAEEVLRLKQVNGMAEAFANREFSEAWEADLPEQDNE